MRATSFIGVKGGEGPHRLWMMVELQGEPPGFHVTSSLLPLIVPPGQARPCGVALHVQGALELLGLPLIRGVMGFLGNTAGKETGRNGAYGTLQAHPLP